MNEEKFTGQTRMESLKEATSQTAIGFLVAYVAWPLAAAASQMPYTAVQHIMMTGILTLVSVARGYLVRRYFNMKAIKKWDERRNVSKEKPQ